MHLPGASDGTVKSELRRDLLAALLSCEVDQVSEILAETFRTVAAADFPRHWPQLLPALQEALAGCEFPFPRIATDPDVEVAASSQEAGYKRGGNAARSSHPPKCSEVVQAEPQSFP
jgi:hypothetical protein